MNTVARLPNRVFLPEEVTRAELQRARLNIKGRALKAKLAKERIPATPADFARQFRGLELADFHEAWYDAFTRYPHSNLLLEAPRESGKTTTVLTYAIWRIVQNRQIRIGIVSKAGGVAADFMHEITKELETNEALLEITGPFKPRGQGVRWGSTQIKIIGGAPAGKDLTAFALGAGSQITGKRADLMLYDDIETLMSVNTEETRARTRGWFAREASPVLAPDGQQIVIGTKKHMDDLYAHLERSGEWIVLDQHKAAIKPDGTSYWPEFWSIEALMKRKRELDAVDIRSWSQEYLNVPMPSETVMFHPEEWPVYDDISDIITGGAHILQAWDLAISSAQSADYTAYLTAAADDDNNIYLMDAGRGHWDFNTTQQQIALRGVEPWEPEVIGIEAVAYQAAAVQEALRRTGLPIIALRPTVSSRTGSPGVTVGAGTQLITRDKVTRARLPEARAAAGKIYRPRTASWWADFATEIASFPGAAHDDWVDCLSYIVHLAAQGAVYDPMEIYDVTECANCAHMYYNPDGRRACPKCGHRPELET